MKRNIYLSGLIILLFSCSTLNESRKIQSSNEILSEVIQRANGNGGFRYLLKDEQVLEEILVKEPNNIQALYTLAWIYSTYERHVNSTNLHSIALIYAQRAYDIAHREDLYMYEILGAAEYANGNYLSGDLLFSHAISNAVNENQKKYLLSTK